MYIKLTNMWIIQTKCIHSSAGDSPKLTLFPPLTINYYLVNQLIVDYQFKDFHWNSDVKGNIKYVVSLQFLK